MVKKETKATTISDDGNFISNQTEKINKIDLNDFNEYLSVNGMLTGTIIKTHIDKVKYDVVKNA